MKQNIMNNIYIYIFVDIKKIYNNTNKIYIYK